MEVLGLRRWRPASDQRTSPAVWLLLTFSAVAFAVRMFVVGSGDTLLDVIGGLLATGPPLLAAAIIFVAPGQRLLVTGGIVLASASLLRLVVALTAGWGADELRIALGVAIAVGFVAGPMLLARGLDRGLPLSGRLLVAAGGALVAARIALAVQSFVATGYIETGGAAAVVELGSSVVAQFAILVWAYLLAVALARGARVLALGAALIVLLDVLTLVTGMLAQQPTAVYAGLTAAYLATLLLAWAALIVGVLRGLGHARTDKRTTV